jgi:phenylpyruvate tautomerase PptA (4-oxalocrotonate tautomerase family)
MKEETIMPFIDSKITVPVTPEVKEELKSELGKLITTLNKTETYLMVGIDDAYDLWLGGKKLEKGAYVSVSLYGNAPAASYDKLTGQICALFESKLGIPGNAVYVTYHPVTDWGWNGSNF